MCGRAFEIYTAEELGSLDEHGESPNLDWLVQNYNLAPTETSPVIVVRDGARRIEPFRWGLIPSWANSVQAASRFALINARGEEITEKRTYAEPIERRRCVVPLSGFYEWRREGKTKRPFAIRLREQPIMPVAGVWECWQPAGELAPIHSFSIVTTAANGFMAVIHDRMPAILARWDIERWLDPEVQQPEHVLPLVQPCPSAWLLAQEVSPLVNSVRNKSPEVAQPLAARERQLGFNF